MHSSGGPKNDAPSFWNRGTKSEKPVAMIWRIVDCDWFLSCHCLSNIAELDQLIVLDQGQIMEEGRHEDLIDTDGLDARLRRGQLGGFLALEVRSVV